MEENNRSEGRLCGKRAAFLSLGCKVNSYETEAMRELFRQAGAQIVDFSERADIYVVNTCTVTNIADRKSRQMLHRAKKQNPDALVAAVGCYVQEAAAELEKDLSVDVLVGNNRKNEIVGLILRHMEQRDIKSGQEDEILGKTLCVPDISMEKKYEELSVAAVEKTRAYIKIQDGCNQFCTYCIIPYARGRIRSRSMQEVEAEVRALVAGGYQEIVLTGIHLSSYGMEAYPQTARFEEIFKNEDMPLVKLIRRLNEVEGITRIRLGSLEPRIVTGEFAKAIAKTKVCPHFHLSLQSGCDATLKRMNRRYDTAGYRESIKILREYFDRPAITTDVIVGFPGETEEEFVESFEFAKEMQFAQMHVFKYSRRKGTKAAEMPNQVSEEIKAARSEKMIGLEEKMRGEFEQSFTGEETEVLLEESILYGGQPYMVGYNARYIKYALGTEENLSNMCVKGHINGDFAGEIPLIVRKQSK